MDELLQQFVIEAVELIQQSADDLLVLEREPASRQHIESLFRSVHTLKGSVGLFDFAPLQKTLFDAEDVLTAANRSGELEPGMIDPLMSIIEWAELCVRQISIDGALPATAGSDGPALSAPLTGTAAPPVLAQDAGLVPEWAADLFAANPAALTALRYVPRDDCFFSGDDPVATVSSVPGLQAVKLGTVSPWPAPSEFDPFRSNLTFEIASAEPRAAVEPVFRLIPDQVSICSRPTGRGPAVRSAPAQTDTRRSLRVDITRVDALVDIVGEFFVAKNALASLAREARDMFGGAELSRKIAATQEEFDRLTSRLQRAATGVRMVPVAETLRRLPRLVREVSAQLGKPVDLTLEGGAIEADRSVVDALFDPLLHILRNAIDHGIEAADLRLLNSKPERGAIVVRAKQRGYRIEVSVSDDGGGVDIERVRSLAVGKGFVTADQAPALSDAEVIELLFRSGFSTASAVSDVSGRGVGMDAVRREAEKLGGRVTLESEHGRGTVVTLAFPTSFAVTRIMVVTAAGERYALPMDAISEMLRIDAGAITPIRAGEAFVLRDRTIPIVRLAGLLGHASPPRLSEMLLVADIGGQRLGLVVDSIGGRRETLLRPASGILKSMPGISGTTVIDDGSVLIVLDLEALIG